MRTVWVVPKRHSKSSLMQKEHKIKILHKTVDRNTGVRVLLDNEDIGSVCKNEKPLKYKVRDEQVGFELDIKVTPLMNLDINSSHLVSKNPNEVNAQTARELILDGTAPEGMVVKGSLYLTNYPVTEIPDNMTVEGRLDLSMTPIKKLPKGLYVKHCLDLAGCINLKELPEDLSVGKHINLENSGIEKLPDNFVVHGNLNISGTPIKKLPKSLEVKNRLIMRRVKIPYKIGSIKAKRITKI